MLTVGDKSLIENDTRVIVLNKATRFMAHDVVMSTKPKVQLIFAITPFDKEL